MEILGGTPTLKSRLICKTHNGFIKQALIQVSKSKYMNFYSETSRLRGRNCSCNSHFPALDVPDVKGGIDILVSHSPSQLSAHLLKPR